MATRKTYQKCKSAVILFIIFLLPIAAYAALTDNGDGTITDSTNSLQWSKLLRGPINWTDATAAADAATEAGQTDWRLPTLAELRTIIDSNYWPQINPVFGMPPDIGTWLNWTSGTIDDEDFVISDRAYVVFFDDGTDRSIPKNNAQTYYRMVRSTADVASNAILWETGGVQLLWETGGNDVVWN